MLSLLLCGVTGAVTVAAGAIVRFSCLTAPSPLGNGADEKQKPDDVDDDAGADAEADADADADAAPADSGEGAEPGDGSGDASEIGAAARAASSPPRAAMLTLPALPPPPPEEEEASTLSEESQPAQAAPDEPQPPRPLLPPLPPWKKDVVVEVAKPLPARRWVRPPLPPLSSSAASSKLRLPPPLPSIDRPPALLGLVPVEAAVAAMAAMLELTVREAWCRALLEALVLVWRGTGRSITPSSCLGPVVSNTRFGQKSIQLSEVARCSFRSVGEGKRAASAS